MTKVTIQMNSKLSSALDELAKEQGTTKADVIRKGITLMKLIDEQSAEGYRLGFSKNGGLEREVLIS